MKEYDELADRFIKTKVQITLMPEARSLQLQNSFSPPRRELIETGDALTAYLKELPGRRDKKVITEISVFNTAVTDLFYQEILKIFTDLSLLQRTGNICYDMSTIIKGAEDQTLMRVYLKLGSW